MSDPNPFESLARQLEESVRQSKERARRAAMWSIRFNVSLMIFYALMWCMAVWFVASGYSDWWWNIFFYPVLILAFWWMNRSSWRNWRRWDDELREHERRERTLSDDAPAS